MIDRNQMIELVQQGDSELTREMAVLMFDRLKEDGAITFDPATGYSWTAEEEESGAAFQRRLAEIAARDLSPGHWGTDDESYFRSITSECWVLQSPDTGKLVKVEYIPESAVSLPDSVLHGWQIGVGKAIDTWAKTPCYIESWERDTEIVAYDFRTATNRHWAENEQYEVPILNAYDTHGELVETIYLNYAAHHAAVEARAREHMESWGVDAVYFEESGSSEKTWVYATQMERR